MSDRTIDVLIVGCGTAALAAAGQVKQVTGNFLIVSDGVYGTTCVRAGCMPAKLLIRSAELYGDRVCLEGCGIEGGDQLRAAPPTVLQALRRNRQHFLEYTLAATEAYRDHIVEGGVFFLEPSMVRVGETVYRAKRVILATGSRPIVPPGWEALGEKLLTSDTLFEQDDLPARMGVTNLSVLGTEIGQALARLGIAISAYHETSLIGGLTDPEVSRYAVERLGRDMDIHLSRQVTPALSDGGIRLDEATVDALFVAMSREANLDGMGLEALGLIGPHEPVIRYDPATMQVGDLPIYVAGDVKLGRSILGEAADEGRIAGYNAARPANTRFMRRTPLLICHTHPTLAVAGKHWDELDPETTAIGEARFDDQGRAKIMGLPSGIIRLYADRESRLIVGSEMFVPMGEHLAHLVALLIDRQVRVDEALHLPFYHPSIEEGLRTALLELREALGPLGAIRSPSQLQMP